MPKFTLKSLRVNVGLTQSEAAKRLNVAKKTLFNWENGNSYPSAEKIKEIEALYGVPYDFINFLP